MAGTKVPAELRREAAAVHTEKLNGSGIVRKARHCSSATKPFVFVVTVVFVPAINQTLVRAADRISTARNAARQAGSQSAMDALTWDRDVSVECFEGDHFNRTGS